MRAACAAHGRSRCATPSPAAAAAIGGIVAVFAVWWIYFDVVDATAHRMIRTMSDARRFQAWSYVHLPLYLGIAVAGVGLERVIETATEAPLPADELGILAGAAATVALSLAIIGGTRRHLRAPGSKPLQMAEHEIFPAL